MMSTKKKFKNFFCPYSAAEFSKPNKNASARARVKDNGMRARILLNHQGNRASLSHRARSTPKPTHLTRCLLNAGKRSLKWKLTIMIFACHALSGAAMDLGDK